MRRLTMLVAALVCAVVALSGPVAADGSDLPRREMHDQVFRNAKGWLVFKGDVDPGWEHRNVRVYKRLCKSCAWKLAKKVETDGGGKWRTRVYAPQNGAWYWKGVVPKAGGYGKSVTQTWRTFVE